MILVLVRPANSSHVTTKVKLCERVTSEAALHTRMSGTLLTPVVQTLSLLLTNYDTLYGF
jgi:hypothetical protein